MKRATVAMLLFALLGVTACGDNESAAPSEPAAKRALQVPAWAKVAPEQIAEAKEHGVPVAFENDLGMRFVLVPAGTFQMGSPTAVYRPWLDIYGDTPAFEELDETQHSVTLSRAFYVQVTETTNAQYRAFAADHGGDADEPPPGTWAVGSVSWKDATAFAAWLSRGDPVRSYRLPTEAEWEYACRAGTQTAFAFGDTLAREQANFERIRARDGAANTTEVARYEPNGWGLYDMHGNVSEWCRDWYGPYGPGERTDPRGPSEEEAEVLPRYPNPDAGRRRCKKRVVRGGYWDARADWLRSAHRNAVDPEGMYRGIGLRIVSPLSEPKAEKGTQAR